MRIGIIGGGSIGLLLSSYLSIHHEVVLYVRRTEQQKVLHDQGLYLSDEPTPYSVHTLLLEQITEADCFIICVKAHQIEDILPFLKQINYRTLLFLQNGMGHLESLRGLKNDVYIGIVEHGAIRRSDNHVNHTGKGVIKIASYSRNTNKVIALTDELNHTKFPFEASFNWKTLLAEKLIINAVINPLTTLFNVPNKEIINNSYIYYLAKKLCSEATTVLQLDYETQLERIKEIAYKTGGNHSSMLMDIKSGRKTEIEAISGFLIANSNVEIPYTSFVYNSIKALENKNEIGR